MIETISSKRFYVYSLALDEAMTQVFYVGKGQNGRVTKHSFDAENGILSPKCSIIRYVKRTSNAYYWTLNHETDDEGEALWHEMKVITSFPYGRLCNQAGGCKISVMAEAYQLKDGWWSTVIRYAGTRPAGRKAIRLENEDLKALKRHTIWVYDDLVLQCYARASGHWLGCHSDWG